MRYPPGHKQEKRKELLNVSSALIKEGGYAATGIDSLMQAAGVTSGAFYSHFASKKELFGAL
ncbi:MAG TPA: TetR/AcrR family transcriptional regulator, partial [Burkholderiaceae bacterium]|nr:TetR/AcrR family transcriptional regulator [Burkholderiaceae bacterium]